MTGFDLARFFTFITQRRAEIVTLTLEHLAVVLLSIAIAMAVGIAVGVAAWDRPISRQVAVTSAALALTIPSLALLAILAPVLGLGWGPTIVALVFYALLPIVRNTIVGIRGVPGDVIESARGMGLTKARITFGTQLPIAWPVIMAGVRVAAQLTIGIAAIAAYVAGPGLGQYIFRGLSSVGSVNALNYALTGTIATILLALAVDGAFVLVIRYSTARGLRV